MRLALLFSILCATPASFAWAVPASEPETPPGLVTSTVPVPQEPAISLVLHSDSPEVTVESLRDALGRELGAEIRLEPETTASARLVVTYNAKSRELAVSFTRSGSETITRIVEAPESASEVTSVAVLLASNLVRQQVTLSAAIPPASAPVPVASVPEPPMPESKNVEEHTHAVFSLFYPLATNFGKPDIHTYFSLNLLYGRIGGLDGLAVGMLNVHSATVRGFQLGALGNIDAVAVRGVQVSGLLNYSGDLSGVQASLGLNVTKGQRIGGQLSLLGNFTSGTTTGAQLTWGLNYSRATSGFSFAGAANVTAGRFQGLQIGTLNYSEDFTGFQAGAVNVARKVTGVQLGIINVADDVDGVPIGLVSVSKSGGIHPVIWSSTAAQGNLGVKFSTRYTYSMLSVSLRHEGDIDKIGPGYTIGASAPLFEKGYFEPDLGATHLLGNAECCTSRPGSAVDRRRDETQFRLRTTLRYAWLKHLSVLGGLGVVGRLTYPLDDTGNTQYKFALNVEAFGGVQL